MTVSERVFQNVCVEPKVSVSNFKWRHIGVLVKLMNRMTEGHFVPPQHIIKELKRLHPSGQPEAPMVTL